MISHNLPPKTAGIYRIGIGDNFYYGSSVKLRNRKDQHLKDLRKNQHSNARLQNAFNKYQEARFELIEVIEDVSKLLEAEQKYLDEHYSDMRCMNLTPTAGSSLGVKHSDEARANMSKSHIGLQLGIFHPLYGKPRSEETKAKISEKLKGVKYTKERLKTQQRVFAGKSFRLKISLAQTGRKQSAETIEKRVSKLRGADNWKSRKVWITLNGGNRETFETVTEAAKKIGVNRATLNCWLLGSKTWPGRGYFTHKRLKPLIGIEGGYIQ